MQFGTGYFQSMDREYADSTDHEHIPGHSASPSHDSTNDVEVGMGEFGMSLALGPVPNVGAIGAKLRGGTKTLEFVFIGTGKGQGQSHTPEMYGLKQRAALVEMGKANEINFTTHATVGVYGLAGMDQQGNFSKQSKDFSLQEIKRAVEFAADVGKGGPVVVHTGEFQRPVVDADWNQKDDAWKNKFKMYQDEEKRASWRVVDKRTGGVISEARKNRNVSRPVWLTAKKGEEYTEDGVKKRVQEGQKVYVDYWGKKVAPSDRVPEYDEPNGVFKVQQLTWDEMIQEADEMSERAKSEFERWDSLSDKQKRDSIWRQRIQEVKNRKGTSEDEGLKIRPEEAYIISTLETNAGTARGWALQYGGDFAENIKNVEKVEKALDFYDKLEKDMPEDEKWKIMREKKGLGLGIFPKETEMPSDFLKGILSDLKQNIAHKREASSAQMAQAEESMETIRYVQSAERYALNEAYDSYATAAVKAWEHTKDLKNKKELRKPIQIALENLFPESYGAHPDELQKLVLGSRDRMTELLHQRGMEKKKAEEVAKTHITSTLDTGHINMWRKYWQGDPKKTIQQNDEEFNDWMIEKIADLTKKDIIGHVHIDDNYGYHDDHLAPGEGNTPIRRMVKTLKENGYKGELIIEPGADYTTDQSGFHSVMKTWRLFGSPIYGTSGGGGPKQRRSWEQVGYGWMGQNQPAYFTFGGYGPSEDWTLWSGVPLE